MRWPRILPPAPHAPWRPAPDVAFCPPCGAWQPTDVIPADTAHDIPPFTICTHCGVGIDTLEEAS